MSWLARRRPVDSVDIWPGWVDALSTMLMVVIFVLTVFVAGQFVLQSAISDTTDQLSGRDEIVLSQGKQIEQLEKRIADLRKLLDIRAADGGALSGQLRALTDERDALAAKASDLETRLAATQAERQAASDRLAQFASTLQDMQTLQELREKMEAKIAAMAVILAEAGRRQQELAAAVADSRASVSARTAALDLSEEQRRLLLETLAAERDRSKALEATLASANEKTMLRQTELDKHDIRLRDAEAQVVVLNEQLAAIRDDLMAFGQALAGGELSPKESSLRLAGLSQRINAALVNKVQELSRYRSEFFGRLREVIGDRPDVRVVGDRFVFQSEVLFPSGSADVSPAGRQQLGDLAKTLLAISSQIPADLDWVLRVDGHTDANPIKSSRFPSNWELSSARATAVVNFLISQGIPPERLVAAGFAQYQPIDAAAADPEALARNRRIEIKLDRR